jgi:hypothetical protein
MLADTVILVLANSVASLFRAAGATYGPSFFVRTVGVTLGVGAFAELLVNMYTSSFWIEMNGFGPPRLPRAPCSLPPGLPYGS